MTAYQIVYARIADQDRLQQYAVEAEKLFKAHGAVLIARGGATPMEGDWPWQGAVVFEWPSRQTALDVWNSPEYARIHLLRHAAAEFQVVVIDGLPSLSDQPST